MSPMRSGRNTHGRDQARLAKRACTPGAPVRMVKDEPEGLGGLRGAAPNEVRSPSLAGGRALRRPEHPWAQTPARPTGQATVI